MKSSPSPSTSTSYSSDNSFSNTDTFIDSPNIHEDAHITLSNYTNKESITYNLQTIDESDIADEPITLKNYTWKHATILTLIHAYDTHKEKFTSIHHKNKSIWKHITLDIHNEIRKTGESIVPSEKQVNSKWRNLKRNYVQHIDKCNQSGEEKKNPPPYFKELGDILGYKANVNPAFMLCSSGEKRKADTKKDTGKENFFKKAKKNNEKKTTSSNILGALEELREDRKELEAKLTKQHEEKMALLERLVNAHENKFI